MVLPSQENYIKSTGLYILVWTVTWFIVDTTQYLIGLPPNQRTMYAIFKPTGHPLEGLTPVALIALVYAVVASMPCAIVHVPILLVVKKISAVSRHKRALYSLGSGLVLSLLQVILYGLSDDLDFMTPFVIATIVAGFVVGRSG